MKNLIRIALTILLALPAFWSCYDDSDLKNQVDSLETRLAAIEKLTAQINTNIASLRFRLQKVEVRQFIMEQMDLMVRMEQMVKMEQLL